MYVYLLKIEAICEEADARASSAWIINHRERAQRSGAAGGVGVCGEGRPGAGGAGGGDVVVMFAELIVGAGRAVTERLRAEHDRYTERTGRPGPRGMNLSERSRNTYTHFHH